MTYDCPFWAIEVKVIPEIANFKEEGLVTPEARMRRRNIPFTEFFEWRSNHSFGAYNTMSAHSNVG